MTSDLRASDKKRPAISRRDTLKAGLLGMAGLVFPKVNPVRAGGDLPLGFCPISGLSGDLINLFGPGTGINIANVSTRIVNGASMAFTLPLSFDGAEVITQITAIPPAMLQGQFVLELGMGARVTPGNMPTGLTLVDPLSVWLGTGNTQHTSFQSFTFPTATSQPDCLASWGSLNLGRLGSDLVFPLGQDGCAACPSGSRLTLRAYGSTTGNAFSFDYQATLVTTTTLYPEQVVDACCVMLESAFDSEFSVNMNCQYTVIDTARVHLSIGAPDASPFVSGALHLAVTHPGGSVVCDSMGGDSMGGDSMSGDSMASDCPSIAIDFTNFLFT